MEKKTQKIDKDTCFVIMPFGGWFDSYYKDIYKLAIEESNMIPIRADDLYRPSSIIDDIWDFTKSAKIILADLSTKNPNVFYELGLAHSITKPAILLTSDINDIPFDLRSLRIIEYNKNAPNWGTELKENIKLSINEILKHPLKAVPPTFVEIDPGEKLKAGTIKHELLEIRNEIDNLKRYTKSENIDKIDVPTDYNEVLKFIYNKLTNGETEEAIHKYLSKRWEKETRDQLITQSKDKYN